MKSLQSWFTCIMVGLAVVTYDINIIQLVLVGVLVGPFELLIIEKIQNFRDSIELSTLTDFF